MSRLRPSIYSILEIEKDGRTVDFRAAAASIDFYEDIFCPTVSCSIQIINSGGVIEGENGKKVSLYEGLKIRGGETVRILIRANSPDNQDIDYNTVESLYVNGITGLIRDDNKEIFTLHLFSKQAYDNEKTFLVKKYQENVQISEHVSTIIRESFPDLFQFNVDIEETFNNFGFIGNQMKPFDAITKLASKAAPAINPNATAGFLFFQTTEGYKFKSIDTLLSAELRDPNKYVYTQYNSSQCDFKARGDLVSLDYKINQFSIIRNKNIVEDFRKGTYSSERRFLNPVDFTVTNKSLNFTGNDYSKIKTAGEIFQPDQEIKIGDQSFSDKPTKIITETFDVGTQTGEDVNKAVNTDPLTFQSQRKMRYNTLFTQIISITVPLNTNLRAGDLVDCVFPSIGDTDGNDVDRTQLSGIYMIKELRHHYDTRTSYSGLLLVRDTSGDRQN